MRIIWHAPCNHPTGYALQTMLFAPRLAGLGHQVVISQMQVGPAGLQPVDGVPVIGPDEGAAEFALPRPERLREALGGHDPDLIIVLKDAWVLNPDDYMGWNTAAFAVMDCEPMPWKDLEFFQRSGARPLVVSSWAQHVARSAGLDALLIPSGIETGEWGPHPDGRDAAKAELGLDPGLFVVGMNAMNVGSPSRKGFSEGFRAFAAFHGKHPASVLACHSQPTHPEGQDLRAIAAAAGLDGHVLFPQAYADHAGMRAWYQALDVFMAPSYGEGFCLPLVEALATGVPVIATDCSALTEKVPHGAGWLAGGQDWWNPHHRAWWVIPSIHSLSGALEKAFSQRRVLPTEYALPYDADLITRNAWKPALDILGGA
jgi:glycosyltransferase involved in cell wall biosynthesis